MEWWTINRYNMLMADVNETFILSELHNLARYFLLLYLIYWMNISSYFDCIFFHEFRRSTEVAVESTNRNVLHDYLNAKLLSSASPLANQSSALDACNIAGIL